MKKRNVCAELKSTRISVWFHILKDNSWNLGVIFIMLVIISVSYDNIVLTKVMLKSGNVAILLQQSPTEQETSSQTITGSTELTADPDKIKNFIYTLYWTEPSWRAGDAAGSSLRETLVVFSGISWPAGPL